MDKNHLDRLIKVREVSDTGSALTRWVALDEIKPAPAVTRDSGQAIFEQPTEPEEAQPGDFWIQED